MKRGLFVSLLLHMAVIGAGYASWPVLNSMRNSEPELVIVPVDLVNLGEITNIAPISAKKPDPNNPAVPEPNPADALMEATDPVDEKLPEAEMESAREAQKPDDQTDPNVLPDFNPDALKDKTKPKDADSPEANVKKPDTSLEEFLDSADSTFKSEAKTRKPQPKASKPRQDLADAKPNASQSRPGAGERTGNTARLEALMYNAVRPCWNGVDDQPSPQSLNVRLRAKLDKDGSLLELKLVEPKQRPLGRSSMGVAIDRALVAVRKCGPYKLPREEYSAWKDIYINLGPAFGPK